MRFLLSIKTVFPKPGGGKVWYDDQREVHQQIFEGDGETRQTSSGVVAQSNRRAERARRSFSVNGHPTIEDVYTHLRFESQIRVPRW